MISVFTPTHDPQYLNEAYASLLRQTDPDWQWTILHNGASKPIGFPDHRVAEVVTTDTTGFVGALKAKACEAAPGDILLELDHDDLLAPEAIALAKKAFADESVGFVYSNALPINMDGTPRDRYDARYGWSYRQTELDGKVYDEPITFEPSPASVSRIWFAPDHFRAFRRSVYEKVGGYSTKMRVLDDQDLMSRMYLETDFRHIDRGLYVYRVHGSNCWLTHNQEIQNNVMRVYDLYAEKMALKWARSSGLKTLELGGRMYAKEGYTTVDRRNADVCCDLEQDWPFPDSSVGVIRAMDVFEHLRDPIHTMKECYRVLAPGGWIFAQVPSTDGRGAFQDPTHKSYWNENSWRYYSHRRWAQYIDTPVRFQLPRVSTTKPNDIGVCWTHAHLISLKDGYRPPGEIHI